MRCCDSFFKKLGTAALFFELTVPKTIFVDLADARRRWWHFFSNMSKPVLVICAHYQRNPTIMYSLSLELSLFSQCADNFAPRVCAAIRV